MSDAKPIIFCVPGAWHPGSLLEPWLSTFHGAGYETKVITNASINPRDPAGVTNGQDVEAARSQLLPLIETQGRDVVMVCHSYGGIVASPAGHGLSKVARRREGKRGGVIGLICISAFVLPSGVTISDALGDNEPGWIKWLTEDKVNGPSLVHDPVETFYHDVPTDVAQKLADSLEIQSMRTLSTSASDPLWLEKEQEGRIAYIRCLQDVAIPLDAQDKLLEDSGVEWTVRDMDTSHSPFAAKPEELTQVCLELMQRFEKA